jgi:hypothetical protein
MAEGVKRDPSERRRRALVAVMLILFAACGGMIDRVVFGHTGHWRPVDYVRVGALMTLALVLALRATTSFRLLNRHPEIDDELTRANRASAATWGFWAVMLGLAGALIASFYWPLDAVGVTTGFVLFGAVIAGLRFVFLERAGM